MTVGGFIVIIKPGKITFKRKLAKLHVCDSFLYFEPVVVITGTFLTKNIIRDLCLI